MLRMKEAAREKKSLHEWSWGWAIGGGGGGVGGHPPQVKTPC